LQHIQTVTFYFTGGNPGNLTRLNGSRVHLIYLIRFPHDNLLYFLEFVFKFMGV